MPDSLTDAVFTPIGLIRTPFPDKYGVPRQPGLVPSAIGRIELSPNLSGAADELEGCSHVWLLWWFHQVPDGAGRNKVRPPRLGGNRRKGVLGTRSPFRPNPIGLSVCLLRGVERARGRATIVVEGVDLVDKTPILDIKPYVPYVDQVDGATVDWVPAAPVLLPVRFAGEVSDWLATRDELRTLISEVLAQDPRPATHKHRPVTDGDRTYAIRLQEFEIMWSVVAGEVVVSAVDLYAP